MDEWSDGDHQFQSFQIAQLAGPSLSWFVSSCRTCLIADYKSMHNLVNPEKALGGFVNHHQNKMSIEQDSWAICGEKLSVQELCDEETEEVVMWQVIGLLFKCECRVIMKENKELKYVKFTNGEVFLFLYLIEKGGMRDSSACSCHPVDRSTAGPPSNISYVSNSVAPDMDELTHNVSKWGGTSVFRQSWHTNQMQCLCGSRMEWTWRTATESQLNTAQPNTTIPDSDEVSDPNPMGNGMPSKASHGKNVAGSAASPMVAQPPTDATSLASSSHSHKWHHMVQLSGQSQHSPAQLRVGNDANLKTWH